MESSRALICCIIFLSFFCLLCCAEEEVNLSINGAISIAETDDNFICATLDWWPETKCDYNQCPWGKAGILNLDLGNKILANAIKAFSPLRIRIGGSLQDQVLYKVGTSAPKCPHFKRIENGLFGFSKGCLDMDRWDNMNKLFQETGAKITFGLNALMGRKKSNKNDILMVGNWNPKNALDFMKYTASKGYKIDSYELGNELCGNGVSARIEAEQYGRDIIVLKKLVQELYPDPATQPKVLGPAGFYDKEWFNAFLKTSGPNVVDGLTHHIYNLGAGAWVGEAGGAYNSGGKEVSHSFVDGFCALLWHRLMGKNVLSASHNGSPYLRIYSHCSKKTAGISVLIINMSNSTTFDVKVADEYKDENQREEYHLTPKDGDILSDVLLLNGTPLKLTESSDIPAMNPQLVDSTSPIKVAPDSIVFATLKGFRASACA
ncbi:hypothetical protein DH2020_049895 [Rehmannia glutinosa]|uniref:Heparanase-like protein 2 n=1 Tax=Rehmannia glutinosa TaxID=99300 RepID=A0ABR0U1R8_REHGL